MTTLSPPAPAIAGTGNGNAAYAHLYCCRPSVAWCGAYIGNEPHCPSDESCGCPDCPACLAADAAYIACYCQNEPEDTP